MRWCALFLLCCTPAKEPERTVVVVPPDAGPSEPVAVASIARDPAPAPPGEISLHDVFEPAIQVTFSFAKGSVSATPDFVPALDLVAASLKEWPRKVSIYGDTRPGEPPFLALKRAHVIKNELVKRGIPATDLDPRERAQGGTSVVRLYDDPGGDPLAVRRKLFDACCASLASSNVQYMLAMDIPDSKIGRAIYDRDKARCAECSGRWGPRGMAGFPGCACKFSDGGKPCSHPNECKGTCDIGYEGALKQSNVSCVPNAPCPLQGTCEQFNEHFGCHGWIEEDRRGLRTTKWICVD